MAEQADRQVELFEGGVGVIEDEAGVFGSLAEVFVVVGHRAPSVTYRGVDALPFLLPLVGNWARSKRGGVSHVACGGWRPLASRPAYALSMKRTILRAAVTAAALACSSQPEVAPVSRPVATAIATDDAYADRETRASNYLSYLRSDPGAGYVLIQKLGDDSLVNMGHAVCRKYDDGHGTLAIAAGLMEYFRHPDIDAATTTSVVFQVLDASTAALCDEHRREYDAAMETWDDSALPSGVEFSPDDFAAPS